MWSALSRSRFLKQYKRLDSQTRFRADSAVLRLLDSPDPARLGKYKKHDAVFAYEIGQKYRLIYDVRYATSHIILLAVCDHKSVYGRD